MTKKAEIEIEIINKNTDGTYYIINFIEKEIIDKIDLETLKIKLEWYKKTSPNLYKDIITVKMPTQDNHTIYP